MDPYEPMKAFKAWNRDTGWSFENVFEEIDVLNLSKILLKFAIVFKFFKCLLSFSEFNDQYWPTKLFQVLQMGYLT